jgi:ComF family protein
MNKLKNFMLELFFPARCSVCNQIGTFLCDNCTAEIIFIKEQTCPKCNKINFTGEYCRKCRHGKSLRGVSAATYFRDENIKTIIHELKYKGYFAIAPTLAEKMVACAPKIKIDFVAFVPASRKRLKKRGYNQAKELAKNLSKMLEAPLLEELIKVKETKSQVGLRKKEREKNLLGAFEYRGPELSGKKILLIDDVKTTGTTLEACAKELKKSGAKTVWGLVFAKE